MSGRRVSNEQVQQFIETEDRDFGECSLGLLRAALKELLEWRELSAWAASRKGLVSLDVSGDDVWGASFDGPRIRCLTTGNDIFAALSALRKKVEG